MSRSTKGLLRIHLATKIAVIWVGLIFRFAISWFVGLKS
jgi:hypothetical protein